MGLKENIKNKRLELGLTLEEVANKIGVKKPTLQRYESGVISNIPSDKIESLAEVFDVSPAYLMGWEDDKKESKSTFNPNVITERDEKKIKKDLKKFMDELKSGQDGPAFYNGVELSDHDLKVLEDGMEFILRNLKVENKKKYTPKKYRK